jgi:hypothetical protein
MDIQLCCELQVMRSGAVHQGITQNLSRNGSLVEIAAPGDSITEGDQVVLRVELPARPLFEQKCMECSGVVTRRYADNGQTLLLGVQLTTVQFRNAARMVVRSSISVGSNKHAL